jgi:hypothetical protein
MGTTLTRGHLPARVYWVRRLLLLLLVLALAWTMTHVFGGDPEPQAKAKQAAASTKGSNAGPGSKATGPTTVYGPQVTGGNKHKKQKAPEPVEVPPEGPCVDDDVVSAPSVGKAYAGRDVTLRFKLHTIRSAACTWRVSPTTVTARITSGEDNIWNTVECPGAIRKQDVVLRRSEWTKVTFAWSGRRSDQGCTKNTDWAMPGWYHLSVSALGGEPQDVQFELSKPQPEVVTKTVQPKPDKKADGKAGKRAGKKKG